MADYSALLAEIDKYQNMARLADQQRMLIEDEIILMTEKIRRVENDARKEKEQLYNRLATPVLQKPPQAPQGSFNWPPTLAREGSSSSLNQSYSHKIKDSIRTLPGFTEFIKNSELLEAFRQSYARDIQDYCKQNTSNLNRDINMSTNSEALESSEGKDRFNYIYSSFKSQKQSKQIDGRKASNHNNTIKEDIREYEEDNTVTHQDKLANASKSSVDSAMVAQQRQPESNRRSARTEKQETKPQKNEKKPQSAFDQLRPDLKESLQSDDREGFLQVPSDAHIHKYQRPTGNSDLLNSNEDNQFQPQGRNISGKEEMKAGANKWINERDPGKANTTQKTTSLREDDYATNFGNNASESDDKSGFVGTPHKTIPQRNTVTSDQSQPIKTTSKKEEVLTFRKRGDSNSKIRFTNEETVDMGQNKESYFDKEYSAGVHRSNTKTNTFQEISHRNYGEQSDLDPPHLIHGDREYILEEDHEQTEKRDDSLRDSNDREREGPENPDGTSLNYSNTRRFTTEENFNSGANQGKRFRISQASHDRFRLRDSRESQKKDSSIQKKDDNSLTINYGTNLTAMPSANHFDGNNTFERDRTLNIAPVVSSDIQKNYGFGPDEISLIKKASKNSGSGLSPTGLTMLRGDSMPKRQTSAVSPDNSPANLPPHLQGAMQRDEVLANRNKEMIDRFDTFFKKMAIDEQQRWEETYEADDNTRLQFLKDSNIGYDEYLEAIGHKKTTALNLAEKTISHKQSKPLEKDKTESKINQSKSISYLSDLPSKINLDGPSIGLRIETGGALVRDTINTIKPRETEFDSARVTTEKLMSLVKSEIPESQLGSNPHTSKKKGHFESGVSASIYPKTVHESNAKSKLTYASSNNFNHQVNEPIEDEPEDDFDEEWRAEASNQMFEEPEQRYNQKATNRNRYSNDTASLSQPSEEIDEVFIDERLIHPSSTVRPTGHSSRAASGKTNVLDSQVDEEEISLSMGMKNPGQIFRNKLSQRGGNNRYG